MEDAANIWDMAVDVAMKKVIRKYVITDIRDVTIRGIMVENAVVIRKEDVKGDARKRDADTKDRGIGEAMAVIKEDLARKDTEGVIMAAEIIIMDTEEAVMAMAGVIIINIAQINNAALVGRVVDFYTECCQNKKSVCVLYDIGAP